MSGRWGSLGEAWNSINLQCRKRSRVSACDPAQVEPGETHGLPCRIEWTDTQCSLFASNDDFDRLQRADFHSVDRHKRHTTFKTAVSVRPYMLDGLLRVRNANMLD